MTHLIVEELESRHLLSGAAGALIAPTAAVPGWTAKVALTDHLERCAVLMTPGTRWQGTECQALMDRHLPANASVWFGLVAREEAALMRVADEPSVLDEHLSPHPSGPQEFSLEPQGGPMAGPKFDPSRPALPPVAAAPVVLADRTGARGLGAPPIANPFHSVELIARLHEFLAHRPTFGGHTNAEAHAGVPHASVLAGLGPEEGAVVSGQLGGESASPLPAPQGAEALAALPPARFAALEAAMRRFLAQLDGSEPYLTGPRGDEALMLWALAGAALFAACETARRQLYRGAAAPGHGAYPLAVLSPIHPHGD